MVRSFLMLTVLFGLLNKADSWIAPMSMWKQCQATAAAIALTASLLGSPAPQDFRSSLNLQPPTQDRPQIQLPSNLQQDDKNAPILEALLYLADSESRPGRLDTIVITARDAKSNEILAGAKIPVSKARFPVQLRLFSQNIVNRQAWQDADDVLVRAVVCPTGSTAIPCSDNEVTMQAEGISKLVRNLPGLPDGVPVRAGASLRLK